MLFVTQTLAKLLPHKEALGFERLLQLTEIAKSLPADLED
jgi:hypothetical protein